jgi:hypothetical protein
MLDNLPLEAGNVFTVSGLAHGSLRNVLTIFAGPFAQMLPDYHFVAVADDTRACDSGRGVEKSREAAMANGFGADRSTETMPNGGSPVSGNGSFGGPIVCADRIGNLGFDGETVTVPLETHRNMTIADKAVQDHVVVAHLRMSVDTMKALRASIAQIELMIAPPTGGQKN